MKKRLFAAPLLIAFTPMATAQAQPIPDLTQEQRRERNAAEIAVRVTKPNSPERLESVSAYLAVTSTLPAYYCFSGRSSMLYQTLEAKPLSPQQTRIAEKFLNTVEECSPEYVEDLTFMIFGLVQGHQGLRSKTASALLALADTLDPIRRIDILFQLGGCIDCDAVPRYSAIDRWKAELAPLPPKEAFDKIYWTSYGSETSGVIEKLAARKLFDIVGQLEYPYDQKLAYFFAAKYGADDISETARLRLFEIVDKMSVTGQVAEYWSKAQTALPGTALEKTSAEKWAACLRRLPDDMKAQWMKNAPRTMQSKDVKPLLRDLIAEFIAEEQKRMPAPAPLQP